MAKTDFLTADMTRRQFMKISGKSLAGLTLSALNGEPLDDELLRRWIPAQRP